MIEHGTGAILSPPRIVSTMEADTSARYKQLSRQRNSMKRTAVENLQHKRKRNMSESRGSRVLDEGDNTLSIDTINNSLSNITASTYCINGADREAASLYCDKRSLTSTDPNGSHRGSFRAKLPQIPTQAYLMEKRLSQASTERGSSRKGSTSTLERDLEIIDILERERSMDIQEMLEREELQPPVHRTLRTPNINRPPLSDYAAPSNRNHVTNHHEAPANLKPPMYQRPVPTIRRTSYDTTHDGMTDPLQFIDRKLIRTKSSSDTHGPRYETKAERARRHSSEKYQY